MTALVIVTAFVMIVTVLLVIVTAFLMTVSVASHLIVTAFFRFRLEVN